MPNREIRTNALTALGATGPQIVEVLAFNEPRPWNPLLVEEPLPFRDEPHLEVWRKYARDSLRIGAWRALADRFVQFHFPIREGISGEDAYLRATLQGILPDPLDMGPPIAPRSPDRLALFIHESAAGSIPVIHSGDRADFINLIRMFRWRNEPVPVPDSMGACLLTGLNNWDRVRLYRERWSERAAIPPEPQEWSDEFQRLIRDRSLYQDTVLIIGSGPYSGLQARAAGFDDASWGEYSVRIRLEHESAHYFTLRRFGRLGHNLLEEILADFYALSRVFGRYDAALALRFLGIEAYPDVRDDGRIHNYLSKLSGSSHRLMFALCHDAVNNIRSLVDAAPGWLESRIALPELLTRITGLSLEEVAHPGFPAGFPPPSSPR